jgi:DivIVA domain-containing protein
MVSGEPAEPDQREGELSPGSSEQGEGSKELRGVPADVQEVSFSVSVRGYDRRAVDAYVTRVNRLIAEREASRSPEAAVRHALEQVGEQTSGILQRVGEAVEEIAVDARQKADESTARAKDEAEETVAKATTEADALLGRSKAEAETMLAQSRKEAAERLQRSEEEITALREEAEARMRELHADTEAIREERRELLHDLRELAARVEEAASAADTRFPPPGAGRTGTGSDAGNRTRSRDRAEQRHGGGAPRRHWRPPGSAKPLSLCRNRNAGRRARIAPGNEKTPMQVGVDQISLTS